MKKTYIKPSAEVMKIANPQLICLSYIDDDEAAGGSSALSREHSSFILDEEEDY